jgi:hypothetical protein
VTGRLGQGWAAVSDPLPERMCGVRVLAAGVNVTDINTRLGWY